MASRLSPVVVTASRTAQRVDDTLADVTVIDREALQKTQGRTLVEVLSQQPGVQFSSNGGLGKTSTLFVRGLEGRHTLLLVDGVRYGSATSGGPSWENLPIEQIERIEIVRGPLSGLYGSDAVGGVVQVFTRRGAQGVRGHGVVSVGSNRHGHAAAGLRAGDGAFDGAVSVQHTETRGFSSTNPKGFGFNPDDDGFRQNALNAQLGWAFAPGWRADARLLHSDGTSHFDANTAPDIRLFLATQVASLEVGGPLRAGWTTRLRASRSVDRATPSVLNAGSNLFETVQQQLGWEHTVDTAAGRVLLLAEHLRQDVRKTAQPYAVNQRTVNALAAGLDGRAGPHGWQANLRHDSNSQFGDQSTGSLGYGHDLTPAWRAAVSVGTSFVAPTFNQLYFPGFGTPTLQPEEGRQREASLRWSSGGRTARFALFENRIRGYIPSGPVLTNIPRSRIDGFSTSYDARVADWTWAVSLDRIDPKNDTTGAPGFGKQLPRRAKNSLKASADVDVGRWRLGGTLVAFDERFDDAANTKRLGGYGTLDLRADWLVAPRWTLGLRLNNLADKRYETASGYNQPGREAFVSLRYNGL